MERKRFSRFVLHQEKQTVKKRGAPVRVRVTYDRLICGTSNLNEV